LAERRMFAKTIIDSDAFLEMPASTQMLYFHLSMRADDEGFINNPKRIMRMVGASEDDFKVLMMKNFIIAFESGVIVIKHWKIHNYIRTDRFKETVYADEKSMLTTKENGAYSLGIPNANRLVYQMDTQVSIGKDSIGKDKDIRHRYGEYKNVLLSDEDLEKLKKEFPNDWENRIENLSSYMQSKGKTYKDHLCTIRNWAKADKEKPSTNTFKNSTERKTDYDALFGGVR